MPETSLPLAPLARTRPTAPQPILDILSCARMNESAYKSPRDGGLPEVSGWTYEALIEFEDSGLALARFRANDGRLYLAVRGTHTARDVAQSLRLFFGQNPASRQEAFQSYIQQSCAEELASGRLCVGGHSLGGLVAAAAAARWNLPGLVQNAPGWMNNPPAPEKLSRLLEIRTSRDTIGEWGTPFPRALVVAMPHLPTLEISALHSVRRQNQALEKAWFSGLSVEDPGLELLAVPQESVSPGLAGLPRRLSRAWRLLKSAPPPDAPSLPQERIVPPLSPRPPFF